MATLTSAYSPQQSYLASVLTGNPNRITVEVEDSIDAAFWKDILCEQCPEKEFHFNPYQTIVNGKDVVEVKGKSRIMKMASDLNQYHIACVDSDNDWILSDYSEAGKTIAENKYLLQTYAYSVENLMCCPETLSEVCKESVSDTTDFDFGGYVEKLSAAIYPLLVWSLYLASKNHSDFTPTSWRKMLVCDFSQVQDILSWVRNNIHETTNAIVDKYATSIPDKDSLEQKLCTEKGLTPRNAYLFIRGHELQSHLLNALLMPITRALYDNHISTLKSSADSNDTKGKQIREYQNRVIPVKDVLERNYRYKAHSEHYQRICSDVMMIWKSNNSSTP